ncbi:MAG: S41 family peptidase, partial [Verrucomicrobia bacterium]|nr:S41 family peptidase [Verrucomicrobiota bacterium]
MKRFLRFQVGTLGLFFALVPFVSVAKTLAPLPHYEHIAEGLYKRLQHEHLLGLPLDDEMSSRAWSNYIAVLDYDRSYFLVSDIARFRAYEEQLDNMLSIGDLSFAFDVFEIYKQRLRDRVAYVENLLATPFDLERDEVYMWKRWLNDTPWPATVEAQNDLWRKRIKNEYIRILLAREAQQEKAIPQDSDATATNSPIPVTESREDLSDPPADTPEQSIIKRYQQTLTVLEDSDAEWVLQNYMSAFTRAYDPHSEFMSPSAAEDFQIEMRLSLMGIGALLRAEDGAAQIVRLIPGGPADHDTSANRLVEGDKIIAVAQGSAAPVDIIHLPLHKAVRLIRGEKGTVVVLTVVPKSDPTGATTKKVTLVRGEVKLEEQAARSAVFEIPAQNGATQSIGVITLPAFYANMKESSEDHPEFRSASHDVAKLIEAFATNHISGLVLDLRNNGGGSLLEAV